ncbi:transposase [Streptomyces sp. NPDC001744]|uniref:transposase n=1 Tax=Streptomyces sp. NPDC001744 TaxID=3364606 RepID=UPI00368087A7
MRHGHVHGHRSTRPRRAGRARTTRTHPQERHAEGTHGPQAPDENRQGRLRPPRKAIVEPVFGQIMSCHNGRRLLLRGEDGARGEWLPPAACHNFRKAFRHAGTAGLAAAIARPARPPALSGPISGPPGPATDRPRTLAGDHERSGRSRPPGQLPVTETRS